jgi:hypothetical protein
MYYEGRVRKLSALQRSKPLNFALSYSDNGMDVTPPVINSNGAAESHDKEILLATRTDIWRSDGFGTP